MPDSLIQNEDAVTIQIGYIISLLILIIFTGGIVTTFYLYTDSSSEQAMRAGFTDLGSVIARDITNMYLTSANSQNNITLNVTRNIPLTIGGKGYRIELKNTTQEPAKDNFASVEIIESGFSGYSVSTKLNVIDDPQNFIKYDDRKAIGVVYSGSGELKIRLEKNSSGMKIWIN